MYRQIASLIGLGLLLSVPLAAGLAQEEIPVKPTPLPDIPEVLPFPSARPEPFDPCKPIEPGRVEGLVKELKAAREQVLHDLEQTDKEFRAAKSTREAEIVKFRLQMSMLLTQLSTRSVKEKLAPPKGPEPQPPAPAPEVKSTPPAKSKVPPKSDPAPQKISADVVDPLNLAHALYRLGHYEKALQSYQSVNLKGMRFEESTPIRYMQTLCLRKLGKVDEAKTLLREIANLKSDETLAHCAQWQLATFAWESDTQARLKAVEQHVKAMEK